MDIDKSKENIQPLRGGRDIARLIPALEAQYDTEMRDQLKQERLEYENRINTYNGPDPLDNWFDFICWTEQSYPKKGHEGSIDQLLRKCLVTFEHNPQYFQDPRLIKLWMKYIDSQPNPTEIYWMLHNRGVGTMSADFYIGWAYYYHVANDFKNAKNIYQMAFKVNAKPIEDLQSAYINFQNAFKDYHQMGDPTSQQRAHDSLAEQRHALTSLKKYKIRNLTVVPSQRTGDNLRNAHPGLVPHIPGSVAAGAPRDNVQLFIHEDVMDSDGMAAAGPSRNPSSILERINVEENIVEPGPWSKPKGLNPTMQLPTNTPFPIHEDAPQLRFPPCHQNWSNWRPPMIVPEIDATNTRPMYIKSQVYRDNKECSFEEINAMKYLKRLKDVARQQQNLQIQQHQNQQLQQNQQIQQQNQQNQQIQQQNQQLQQIHQHQNQQQQIQQQQQQNQQIQQQQNQQIQQQHQNIHQLNQQQYQQHQYQQQQYQQQQQLQQLQQQHQQLPSAGHFQGQIPNYHQEQYANQHPSNNMTPSNQQHNIEIAIDVHGNQQVQQTQHQVYQQQQFQQHNVSRNLYPEMSYMHKDAYGNVIMPVAHDQYNNRQNNSRNSSIPESPANNSRQKLIISPQVQQHYTSQPNMSQVNYLQSNMSAVLPGTPPHQHVIAGHAEHQMISNQYVNSPHSASMSEHRGAVRKQNSYLNRLEQQQMQSPITPSNNMTLHTKDIMKEVDDWYSGISPKQFNNSEVRSMQQHQPFTIYQSPTEQTHNLRQNQQQRPPQQQTYDSVRRTPQHHLTPVHLQERHYNENVVYTSNEQHQHLHQNHNQQPSQQQVNHASAAIEHNYVGNHYMPVPQRNDINPHANHQYNAHQPPEMNGFNGITYDSAPPAELFDQTCSTQTFNVNMYKAEASTPIRKPSGYSAFKEEIPQEQSSESSPDMAQLLSSNLQNEVLYASREPVQMQPHLSVIMENTENRTTSSTSIALNSLGETRDSTTNQNTTPNNLVFLQNGQKLSASVKTEPSDLNRPTAVAATPTKVQAGSLSESPKVLVISRQANIPKAVRCITPPNNKYTEYRNKEEPSPTPTPNKQNNSVLPGTPEQTIQTLIKVSRQFEFASERSGPNISKSMQNTLHISNTDSNLSIDNKWKPQIMDESSIDDYEMDCQDTDAEKGYSEEIIKKHLSKDVIDPFNSELCEAFLIKVGFPSRDNSSCIHVRNIAQLKQGSNCSVGPKHYNIEKELGRGAFGSIYRAVDLNTGEIVALKYQKPPRIWEYYICQEIRKRITNNDILPGFMEVSMALVCRSASILVSEFGRYGSLLNASNKVKQATSKTFNEIVVISFTSQMLSVVYYLHRSKIIHGDIKPDNILLMNIPLQHSHIPCLQFIDFGCAIDMSLFPEGTEFKTVVTTDGFTCTEMQERRPWTYQTDLFCLAATTHVCLFGEYMKLVKRSGEWSIKNNIPRYFQKDMWTNFFSKLLNISNSNSLPDLLEIKKTLDEFLSRNHQDYTDKIRLVANIMNDR